MHIFHNNNKNTSRNRRTQRSLRPMFVDLEDRVVLSTATVGLAAGVLSISSTDPTNDIRIDAERGGQIHVNVISGNSVVTDSTFALTDVTSISLTGVGDLHSEHVSIPVTLPDGAFGTLTGSTLTAVVANRVLTIQGSAGNDTAFLHGENGLLAVNAVNADGTLSHYYVDKTTIDSVVYQGNGGTDNIAVGGNVTTPVTSPDTTINTLGSGPHDGHEGHEGHDGFPGAPPAPTVTSPGVTVNFGTTGASAVLDASGVLTVTGRTALENIFVGRTPDNLVVVEVHGNTPTTAIGILTPGSGLDNHKFFTASAVQSIVVQGNGGTDVLNVAGNLAIPVTSPDTTVNTVTGEPGHDGHGVVPPLGGPGNARGHGPEHEQGRRGAIPNTPTTTNTTTATSRASANARASTAVAPNKTSNSSTRQSNAATAPKIAAGRFRIFRK